MMIDLMAHESQPKSHQTQSTEGGNFTPVACIYQDQPQPAAQSRGCVLLIERQIFCCADNIDQTVNS